MTPDFYSLFAYGSAMILSMFFASKYEKSNQKKYLVFSFLSTLLFCGCRFYVGNDYQGYYDIFDSIREYQAAWILIEPAYGLLNLLFSFSPIGYIYVLFVCSLITYTIVFYLLSKYKLLKWGIFAIYTLGFLIIANDQVRQMTALPFFLLSLEYVEKRKPVKFLICILIASTFHYSAAICLFAYFLRYIRVNKKIAIILLIIALITKTTGVVDNFLHGLSSYVSFFNETYARKVDNDAYYSEATFGIQLLYFFLVAIFSMLTLPKEKYENIYVKVFSIGAILYMLFWGQLLFERVSLYFFESIIIVFPLAFSRKNLLGKLVIIMCLSYFTLQSLFALEKNGAIPYRTIFNEKLENPIYDKNTQTN